MSGISRGMPPLATAAGITIIILLGIIFFQKDIAILWSKPTIMTEPLTMQEYSEQFPLKDFAGIEISDQNQSEADVYGTLINIDTVKSLAILKPEPPKDIGDVLQSSYGVAELEKKKRGVIMIYLNSTTKVIDPFAGRERNYQEMVVSQDGNIDRFLGLYIHVSVTANPDGMLVADQIAAAGVSQ